MLLTDLLERAHIAVDVSDVEVTGVALDSRKVQPGDVFIAVPGTQSNGLDYAVDAIAKGAVAIVHAASAKNDAVKTSDVAMIPVDNVRKKTAHLAAAFYAQQPEHIVGITGTNGKTSVAEFTRQLWRLTENKAASIGTLGLTSSMPESAISYPSGNTSPDPVTLHEALSQLVQHDVRHCAIEASSHGIEQERVGAVNWQSCAFTNLSRDHLDYHGTMEKYFDAKAALFRNGNIAQGVVICADDAHGKILLQECQRREEWQVWDYGFEGEFLKLLNVTPHTGGMHLQLRINGEVCEVEVPVYGTFQALNIVCAIGLVMQSNVLLQKIIAVLPKLSGVRGRLEKAGKSHNGASVFIDYAHTPDALENVLTALRPHAEKNLHVVFGCGGDRDAGKRPQMGEVASRLADNVIVTDDNPRTENPSEIRQQILAAAPQATEIADRAEAIFAAVRQCDAGDVLVIAGKGHETYQIIGAQKLEFNDLAIAREALANAA